MALRVHRRVGETVRSRCFLSVSGRGRSRETSPSGRNALGKPRLAVLPRGRTMKVRLQTPPSKRIRIVSRLHLDPRRPRAQPQGLRPRDPARQARRDHRAVRLRQELAGVRHHLRRGPAPLRRVALGVRAAVPRPDGQARRRPHRGAVAGGLDRPEDDVAEPALDGGHGHRDLRLPAPALRARRHPALPDLRPRDRAADARPDRRPHPRAGRGHEVPGARAGREGPQGRVRQALRRPEARGLHARARRRRGARRSTRRSCSTRSTSTTSTWSSTGSS